MAGTNESVHKLYWDAAWREPKTWLVSDEEYQRVHNDLAVIAARDSVNFKPGNTIGDVFSRIPAEILGQIMKQVMQHPGRPLIMSTDVLRMRLVCEQFNAVALDVWTGTLRQQMRTGRYLGIYTHLKIDPHKQSLAGLARIFAPTVAGRSWAGTIENISMTFKPMLHHETLETLLRAHLIEEWSEDELEGKDLDLTVRHNLEVFKQGWHEHTTFQNYIASDDGKREVQDMLLAMPNLKTFHLFLEYYWQPGLAGEFGKAEPRKRANQAYWDWLPHMLGLLSQTPVKCLNLTVDSCSFEPRYQLDRELVDSSSYYTMLTTISLDITRWTSDFEGYQYEEPPLENAAGFREFLKSLRNLETLRLSCHADGSWEEMWENQDFREYGNADWLEKVLKDQHWPGLTTITLSHFVLPVTAMAQFLTDHRRSLQSVKIWLSGIDTNDNVLALIKHMRNNLSLGECFLNIGVMEQAVMVGELRAVARAYCGWPQRRNERLVPGDYVDENASDADEDYEVETHQAWRVRPQARSSCLSA